MADNVIQIIISAVDQSAGAISKSDSQIKNWTDGLLKATAAATAVGFAVKKGYDFIKEGAALELAEGRFDRLAASIGTTSEALKKDLAVASRGMLTDAEQIASATDLMSLGLTKTHDQTVRLSAASSALNFNMNQLVLTLANRTTMRFDALGVSTDGFKDKLKELEDQGYSVEDAFTEAFLQQAEAQIAKVGHAADTTAGRLQQIEVRFKNISDLAKQSAAESGFVDSLLDTAEMAFKAGDAAEMLDGRVINLRAGIFKISEGVRLSTGEFISFEEAIMRAEAAQRAIEQGSWAVSGSLKQQKMATQAVAEAQERSTVSLEEGLLRAYQDWADVTDDVTDSLDDLLESQKTFLDIDTNITSALDRYIQQARLAELGLGDWETELAQLNQDHADGKVSLEDYEEAVNNYRVAALLAKGATEEWSSDEVREGLQGLGLDLSEIEHWMSLLEGTHNAKLVMELVTKGFSAEFAEGFLKFAEQSSSAELDIIYGGKKAAGGPVAGGRAYMVGEKGPELFMPGQNGSIVPNNQLGGGSDALLAEMQSLGYKLDSLPRKIGEIVGSQVAKRSAW